MRDISSIPQLYDFFRVQRPRQIEKLMVAIRMGNPFISTAALQRRVVDQLLQGDPGLYRGVRENLARPGPEPMRFSPLEQIKMRTAVLNPMGEMTGGNYTAAF